VRGWVLYAAISALLVGLSASVVGWLVQLAAFALLLAAAGRRADLVVAGWTAGTVLRLVVLGLLAWLSLGGVLGLPAEPTLLALVFGLFALLLLEAAVFRRRLVGR
jgi:hypothetical protein